MADAVKYLQRTLEINPRYEAAHYLLGLYFLMEGKVGEAVEHLRETVRINPGNEAARNKLEMALALQAKEKGKGTSKQGSSPN